jgi:hypothetical protein
VEQPSDILFNEDFDSYRLLELDAGVSFLKLIWNDKNPEYTRGALAMLNKIIKMPQSMAISGKQREVADMQVNRILQAFNAKMIKAFVFEDGE